MGVKKWRRNDVSGRGLKINNGKTKWKFKVNFAASEDLMRANKLVICFELYLPNWFY